MLTHIVIWKYRSDVTQEQRDEHIALLRRLPLIISDIISFKVGFDMLHLPRSYNLGLVAIFPDREALDKYTVHPEHVKVADFGKTICDHVASVDFVE